MQGPLYFFSCYVKKNVYFCIRFQKEIAKRYARPSWKKREKFQELQGQVSRFTCYAWTVCTFSVQGNSHDLFQKKRHTVPRFFCITRCRHRIRKMSNKQHIMKRVLFFAALCCAMLFQTLNAQEITDPQTLYRRGGKIVSDVRPMSGYDDATLQAILGERDFDLYSHNHKLYTKGKTLTTIGWVGLPVGGFLFLIGHIHSYYYYDSPDKYLTSYLAQLLGYAITGVSCVLLPTGYTIKGVAAGRISRIAEGYNATHNKGTELSLSMSPTLMNNHGQIAPGVGLTLRF